MEGLTVRNWLLLVYKIPNEPTAGRVFVWRKLKKLAAILVHDAVWVLPATAQTREHFRWLATEIAELGGEAAVWESRLSMGDEDKLIEQFTAAVEQAYREILAAMKHKDADLAALSRRFQQARVQDFFDSELGQRLLEAFIAAKGGPK
jgi:hypothetical protein